MAIETGEVVSEVVALADEAHNISADNAVLESALENAIEREGAAIQTAEQIAAAAMESVRGQEIENLRKDISTWQDKCVNLELQMNSLQSSLEVMTGQMAALATLQVSSQTTLETGLSSSIPEQSEVAEAITEVQEILPETLQNVVEENPVAQTPVPARKRRWI